MKLRVQSQGRDQRSIQASLVDGPAVAGRFNKLSKSNRPATDDASLHDLSASLYSE
jgi:hypothetical protein